MLEVYDRESIGSNILLGSLVFSIKELIEIGSKPGGTFLWKNVYGSHKEGYGECALAMRKNPEIASKWKGMILMHFGVEDKEKPIKKVTKLDKGIK